MVTSYDYLNRKEAVDTVTFDLITHTHTQHRHTPVGSSKETCSLRGFDTVCQDYVLSELSNFFFFLNHIVFYDDVLLFNNLSQFNPFLFLSKQHGECEEKANKSTLFLQTVLSGNTKNE